jgi:hypothetical protein
MSPFVAFMAVMQMAASLFFVALSFWTGNMALAVLFIAVVLPVVILFIIEWRNNRIG